MTPQTHNPFVGHDHDTCLRATDPVAVGDFFPLQRNQADRLAVRRGTCCRTRRLVDSRCRYWLKRRIKQFYALGLLKSFAASGQWRLHDVVGVHRSISTDVRVLHASTADVGKFTNLIANFPSSFSKSPAATCWSMGSLLVGVAMDVSWTVVASLLSSGFTRLAVSGLGWIQFASVKCSSKRSRRKSRLVG